MPLLVDGDLTVIYLLAAFTDGNLSLSPSDYLY